MKNRQGRLNSKAHKIVFLFLFFITLIAQISFNHMLINTEVHKDHPVFSAILIVAGCICWMAPITYAFKDVNEK